VVEDFTLRGRHGHGQGVLERVLQRSWRTTMVST
jgi:hypothetical protein